MMKVDEQEGKWKYIMFMPRFCFILLAKVSPKASLEFDGGETDVTSLVRAAAEP